MHSQLMYDMQLTQLSRSRARISKAGISVIDSEYSNDKWYLESPIGEIYGLLKPQLESIKDTLNKGDINGAVSEAKKLVIYGATLLTKVMKKSDLYANNNNFKEKMIQSIYYSLGSYMEQEDKKEDQWVDESFNDLYLHTKHEIKEIRKNITGDDLDFLLHNSTDFVLLSIMLLETVSEQTKNVDNFEKS